VAAFESLCIDTPGARLDVRHYPGSGDPILLLHGGPGMGNYFDSFPETLSPHRVVSYDQRGCGRSSCDGSFDVAAQVADLDAIRQHLGAGRIHLFGHSWGGLLAQLYAKAHPARVASLVLCCSMANTGRKVATLESKCIAERVIARPKRSPLAWVVAGPLFQLPGRAGDLGFGLVMKQLLPNYLVRPDVIRVPFDVTRGSKRAWRATNASIKTLDDDYLAGISLEAPVLIIRGEQDVIRETHPLLSARFPHATNVIIPNASHFPWVEQPDAFSNAIRGFYPDFVSA
jgi:proline iminopeptidase